MWFHSKKSPITKNIKPFAYLNTVKADVLFPLLKDEHPQTIALVLSYLDLNRKKIILQSLSIVSDFYEGLMNTLKPVSPDIMREVERVLERKIHEVEENG